MTTNQSFRSHRSRIFSSRITFLALAAFALLTLATTSVFMAGLSGAIFTSIDGCGATDQNIYSSKDAVFLSGGPNHGSSAGLPDGYYYVQVTAPGGTLLGTSVGSGLSAPGAPFGGQVVHVTGGVFDECYHLSSIVKTALVADPACVAGNLGYCTTPNAGGEYKVWVSTDSTFPNDSSKTDNFKVIPVECPPDDPECNPQPPQATLNVIKFYDANANGILDGTDQELTGWKVHIADDDGFEFDAFTPVSSQVDPNCFDVTEASPIESGWFHTTADLDHFCIVANETHNTTFGNVCLGGGTGLTLGFWSNKNGQKQVGADDLAMLASLNLRNADGSNFDPTQYAPQFRTWLLSASATNMSYMLSAQLAAMELNVYNSIVPGSSVIYAPGTTSANAFGFATVNAVMAEANTELGLHGLVVAAGATRTYQEALKNALDKANNNLNFVSPTPCAFSFAE